MGDGRTQSYLEFSCFINPIAFSSCIQYFMNNCVETKERRAFVLLRQQGVSVISRLHCIPGVQLCSHVSARSGQRRLSYHQAEKNININNTCKFGVIWSQRICLFSQVWESRGCLQVPNMWDTQTLSQSLLNLLQSGPSLNFRPELCWSVPGSAPVTFPGTSMANPNTEHRMVGTVFRQRGDLWKFLHASVFSSEKQNY